MTRKTSRIEPTLSGDNQSIEEPIVSPSSAHSSSHGHNSATPRAQRTPALPEQIKAKVTLFLNAAYTLIHEKLLNTKQKRIATSAAAALVIAIILLTSLFTSDTQEETIIEPEINEAVISDAVNLSNRTHAVTLPDNFSLMATDYNGIVIHWQAETSTETKIWDIHTTSGEESCQAVVFNNGERYRALNVLVENEKDYYANFSPLDTASIIKAVALRGNFTLCGYKFSLKGSQSVLGKHYYYSDMLSL